MATSISNSTLTAGQFASVQFCTRLIYLFWQEITSPRIRCVNSTSNRQTRSKVASFFDVNHTEFNTLSALRGGQSRMKELPPAASSLISPMRITQDKELKYYYTKVVIRCQDSCWCIISKKVVNLCILEGPREKLGVGWTICIHGPKN